MSLVSLFYQISFKLVYIHIENVSYEYIIIFYCKYRAKKKNKPKNQCYVEETHMELHVFFIYNILKRKLQVLVYVMPGICIKSYIKTKKTMCAIRSEKKICNQSLSSKYEENQ